MIAEDGIVVLTVVVVIVVVVVGIIVVDVVVVVFNVLPVVAGVVVIFAIVAVLVSGRGVIPNRAGVAAVTFGVIFSQTSGVLPVAPALPLPPPDGGRRSSILALQTYGPPSASKPSSFPA